MIAQNRGTLSERLQALKIRAADFAARAAALNQEITDLIGKQSELQRFHGNVRRFGHLLAWNEWNDWQTAGPGRWLTFGHDYRVAFTERLLIDLIAERIVFGESAEELGFRFTPDGDPVVSLSEATHFIDSITVRFTGELAIRGIRTNCTITLELIVHPLSKDPEPTVRLLRLPQITLGETPMAIDLSRDRWRLTHWLQRSRFGSLLSELPNVRFGDGASPMYFCLHSVHATDVLTFFYSREFPTRPLDSIMGNIGRTPQSNGAADIAFYVTDDLITSSLSSQFGEHLGILPYDRDSCDGNAPVYLFTYKKEIQTGGSVDLIFWRFTWSYSTTIWPNLWIRLHGNVQQGAGVLSISVAAKGACEPANTAVFANLPGVTAVERIIEEGKGFCFHITRARTR